MAGLRCATVYKKQNGYLALSRDRGSVSWTPSSPPDAVPALVLTVPNITNLQQTPKTSPKVMLKIYVQNPGQTEPLAHTFAFSSPDQARAEADTFTSDLSKLIAAHKALQEGLSTSTGQSAAMTMASAISGRTNWEDDEKLLTDLPLQNSLLKTDKNLNATYLQAVQLRPATISNSQFTTQFWKSRIHLLRAHALSKGQEKGKYNVLSIVKNDKRIDLTEETINDIFVQYPLVQRIYNEVTDPKSELPKSKRIPKLEEFWARFFQSRLYNTLRGMKGTVRDQVDLVLDDYLDAPELTGLRPTSDDLHISKFIDLEGNEENHSQRKGNRPDQELRQAALEKAPVIRKLNAISEKLMQAVKPSDVLASEPIGMDEAEYEALRLRDLADDPELRRIELKIRDQSRFFSQSTSKDTATNPFANIDPQKAITSVLNNLSTAFPHPGDDVVPVPAFEEMDLDDEDASAQFSGSTIATDHILSLIQTHQSQTAPIQSTSNLPQHIYTQITLNHSTTLEFLRQFWHAFLSGDPARANELTALVESLNSGFERINDAAEKADTHRQEQIKKAEAEGATLTKTTGKKRKVDYSKMPAGGDRVKELCGPLIGGLNRAVQEYKKEYELQTREVEERERAGTPLRVGA